MAIQIVPFVLVCHLVLNHILISRCYKYKVQLQRDCYAPTMAPRSTQTGYNYIG